MNVDRKAWQAAMRRCAKVTPRRCPRPILESVLLSKCGEHLDIIATDGAIGLRLTLAAHGADSFAVAVPLAALKAATAGKGKVPVVVDVLPDGKVRADCATLHAEDAALWPAKAFPAPGDGPVSRWDAGALREALTRVTFAASRECGRYAFHGVLLDVGESGTAFVGTDGRRLAVSETECNGLPKAAAIIPNAAAALLADCAKGEADGVRVYPREWRWAFHGDGWALSVALLEGEFPDFRAVLPRDKDLPCEVRVMAGELLGCIRQAATTAGEQGRAVEMQAKDGVLHVTSRQEGVGETRVCIAAGMSADGPAVRYNPEFLSEALAVLPADAVVRWRFKDRATCATLSVVDRPDWTYAVMPITS